MTALTKAYLVKLSGMGDYRWYLLDEGDWNHLDACEKWDRWSGKQAPVPPYDLIERVFAEQEKDHSELKSTREEILYYLTPQADSGTAANDVALSMPASLFDGESFDDYDGSVRTLNAFVKKHKLKIEDEYEGGIY